METNRCELNDGIATLVLDEPGSPVNTTGVVWAQPHQRLQIGAGPMTALGRRQHHAAVCLRPHSNCIAPAVRSVCQSTPHDAIGVGAGRKRIKQNFRLIETMGVPVVSCLNGSTLGGGWEVMLVGHHRTAIDDSRIRLGLPAVEQRADQAEQPRHLRHAAHAVQQDQRHGCRSSASSGR